MDIIAMMFVVTLQSGHIIDGVSQSLPDHIIPSVQINLGKISICCTTSFNE